MPHVSMHSPIGDLTVFEADGAVVALESGWAGGGDGSALLGRVVAALDRYFDGVKLPDDLPLSPDGTDYQRRVWDGLRAIPHGAVCGYAQLARRAGGAARSVGQAVARNPIPILIPCHRVIAASGPGGYSFAGGVATKRFLLDLERAPEQGAASGSLT